MSDSPYRAGVGSAPTDAAAQGGIVADLIEQFADPFAFYRELVQNAIDAGTSQVHVTIHHADAELRVAVIDDGEGMSREVLEERLVVLFRSTKENDDTKIGKFGVGFVSVLAVRPSVVAVQTCDGETRHAMHLYADHRYELYEVGASVERGTTVTLHVPMAADDVGAFVTASAASLERWCRHARVPIHFLDATDPDAEPRARRIDRALDLEGLVSVRAERDGMVAIVGVGAGPPYAGFFNRGLTLYETREPTVLRVSFKVQGPRLEHTLSRDDVRRDGAYHAALAFVAEVARARLPAAVSDELRRLAEEETGDAWLALLRAAVQSHLPLAPDRAWLPLAEPVGDRRVVRASELGGRPLGARRRSALTRRLAQEGRAVVHLGAAGAARAHIVEVLVEALTGDKARIAEDELVLVSPVPRTGADELLVARVAELLDRVYRRPAGVTLAELDGRHTTSLFVATPEPDAAVVVEAAETLVNPFRLLARPALALNVAHETVAAARRRAEEDAEVAAVLLTRAVLLHREVLSPGRCAELTRAGLDAILGGST